MGWKPELRTRTSEIWVLPGALRSEGFRAAWYRLEEGRGTYRTASVSPLTACQCSYSCGPGPAIGPHAGRQCFAQITRLWRALAPLMSPWSADGDVPTAANLNLHGGLRSHAAWHCDDEPLFGGCGDSKLTVSLSPGSTAAFKWKAKSCSDSEASSYCLHHGELLVMDGRSQDEYLHCTSPGLADRWVNITYRWIGYHMLGCHLAAAVLGSLPSCAQGSPVLGADAGETPVSVLASLGFLVALVCGLLYVLSGLAPSTPDHRSRVLLSPQCCSWGQNWRDWSTRYRTQGPGGLGAGQENIAFFRYGEFGRSGCLIC